MLKYLVCFFVLSIPLFAQDPPKPVDPVTPPVPVIQPMITVPQGVVGDGKRGETAYTFDSTTICVLMFPNPALDKFTWDIEDSAPGSLVMPGGGAVAFNLEKPGEYLLQCSWEGGKSKAWFVVKSGNSPPPVDNAQTALVKRLKTALVGIDAKSDAAKFSALCKGFADFIGTQPATLKYGPMLDAWIAARNGVEWPAGKYPDMPGIIRDTIPTVTDTIPPSVLVTPESKTMIISNLRALQEAADKIAKVK